MRIGVEKNGEINDLNFFYSPRSKHHSVESHQKTGHDSANHWRGGKGVKSQLLSVRGINC